MQQQESTQEDCRRAPGRKPMKRAKAIFQLPTIPGVEVGLRRSAESAVFGVNHAGRGANPGLPSPLDSTTWCYDCLAVEYIFAPVAAAQAACNTCTCLYFVCVMQDLLQLDRYHA